MEEMADWLGLALKKKSPTGHLHTMCMSHIFLVRAVFVAVFLCSARCVAYFP